VRRRLDQVRASGVRILFAIESGSRAWGFPSPDSDYDCRFVYLRSIDDHLRLDAGRDVIEFPIDGEIDTGGWDLRKALLLALKGNAVIGEWVDSPFCYEEVDGFRPRFRALLEKIVVPAQAARHYAGLLRHHVPKDASDTKLKRLFYALRPALSLQYMQERDYRELPPMSISQLLEKVELDVELRAVIDDLLAMKKATREMGTGPMPAPIQHYLDAVNARYAAMPRHRDEIDPESIRSRHALAENFYIDMVRAENTGATGVTT
jgi:predicted nucleotidyltransferase